ncbi:hypothetical protein [Chromobacterium haemolyticum]|uniref:hypothetical protein n=1 Tax=Chromobacterium haemolyticum TaxID=394935 RepID=UPI001FEFC15E|nr:hypothetical protein [Chromobacterium haemolyticum]
MSSPTARPTKIVPRPGFDPLCTGRRQDFRENKDWLSAVGTIRKCVRCGSTGAVQVAHRNEGKGMGLKNPDCLTAALCIHCHGSIDNGNRWTLEHRRREMDRAIVQTLELLVLAGVVVIDKARLKEIAK